MKEKNEIKTIIWWLLVLSIASTIGYIIIATLFTLGGAILTGNDNYEISTNIYHIVMAIYRIIETCVFVYFIEKSTFKTAQNEKTNKKIIIPSIIISIFFVSLFIAFTHPQPIEVSFGYIFRILLIAPIFEELMFRGAIQSTIKKYCGPKYAILLSTLLFAMYHMSFTQFILVIPLGLICGYIAENYSIKNSIIAHAAFNSVNILNSIIPGIYSLLLLISSIYLVFYLIRNKKKFIFDKTKYDNFFMKKALISLPMILFSFIWILCIISDLM